MYLAWVPRSYQTLRYIVQLAEGYPNMIWSCHFKGCMIGWPHASVSVVMKFVELADSA